jgi:hypothetical protein
LLNKKPRHGAVTVQGRPVASDRDDASSNAAGRIAKAYRSAAEHHGKGDHAKGKEHAASAKQHSQTAHQHIEQAHAKSQQQK